MSTKNFSNAVLIEDYVLRKNPWWNKQKVKRRDREDEELSSTPFFSVEVALARVSNRLSQVRKRSKLRCLGFFATSFHVLPYRPVPLIDLGADRKLSICSSTQRSVGSASKKKSFSLGFRGSRVWFVNGSQNRFSGLVSSANVSFPLRFLIVGQLLLLPRG